MNKIELKRESDIILLEDLIPVIQIKGGKANLRFGERVLKEDSNSSRLQAGDIPAI